MVKYLKDATRDFDSAKREQCRQSSTYRLAPRRAAIFCMYSIHVAEPERAQRGYAEWDICSSVMT